MYIYYTYTCTYIYIVVSYTCACVHNCYKCNTHPFYNDVLY